MDIKNVAVYLGSADVANCQTRQAVIDLADYLTVHNMPLVFGGSSCGMMKLLADTMLAKKQCRWHIYQKFAGKIHPSRFDRIHYYRKSC